MKKVQRLLSMTDGDERKHVLDCTYVDLHYVEDQRKNLLNKFNSLNLELSYCMSKLSDLKNTKALKCSLQNEIVDLNLDNESLKDKISELKKVIEKWTSSEVTLDQLSIEQVPGNIARALRGKGKKKNTIPSKEALYSEESGLKVVFGDNSSGDTEGYGLISVYKDSGNHISQNNEVVLIAPRRRDIYVIDMSSYNEESNTCFFAKASNSVNWLWQKRLSHLNFKNINKLARQNLVTGLPSLTYLKDKICSACEKRKASIGHSSQY
ncbi:retrovirus-related pol polyprotein from transposon TNT 1-94 [Tanacetum coccineum]